MTPSIAVMSLLLHNTILSPKLPSLPTYLSPHSPASAPSPAHGAVVHETLVGFCECLLRSDSLSVRSVPTNLPPCLSRIVYTLTSRIICTPTSRFTYTHTL